MSRSLKMLGLVVAAMALSAMLASMASAQGKGVFTSGATPTTHTATPFYATQEGAEPTGDKFFAFEETLHCENANSTFKGETSGTDTEITVTPDYKDCFSLKKGTDEREFAITVTTNGCTFTFTQPTAIAETEDKTWEGKVDVVCPEGKAIEVEAYTGTPTEHGSLVLCRETITSQNELGKVVYHLTEDAGKPDDLTATVEVVGIHAVKEGLCGAGETNVAEYKSTLTVTSGKPGTPGTDDLWISTEP